MKKLFAAVLVGSLMVSCGDEEKKETNVKETVKLEVCDCVEPSEENKEACSVQFDSISIEQIKICTGDTIPVVDSVALKKEQDSILEAYQKDLSLKIKEIPEEKEDPISDECKKFLEDYADAIKHYTKLLESVEKNPDNISLKISLSSSSEDLYGWSSKPQMFQCSQTESFKKQVEILNNKRDKLIEA